MEGLGPGRDGGDEPQVGDTPEHDLGVSSPHSGLRPRRHDLITKGLHIPPFCPLSLQPGGQQAESCSFKDD